MGNAAGKLTPCLCPASTVGEISRRHDIAVVLNHPLAVTHDNGLGHSFCYIRPDQFGPMPASKPFSAAQTAPVFRTISGASISANTSTPLSTTLLLDPYPAQMDRAASFDSSSSFASVPLQPIPRHAMVNSGPLPARHSGSGSMLGSGPIERGFLSGPIERGFISGPLDHRTLQEQKIKYKYKLRKWRSIKGIKDSILGALSSWGSGKGYDSIKYRDWKNNNNESSVGKSSSIINFSSNLSLENEVSCSSSMECQNLQWAQGKAGEDRVHIVISEDHGWVFVGIYDGFNGPDAPDFLLSNLYSAVHKELIGLRQLWNDRSESELESVSTSNQSTISKDSTQLDEEVNNGLRRVSGMDSSGSGCGDPSIDPNTLMKKQGENGNGIRKRKGVSWDSNIMELDERIREKMSQMGSNLSNKFKHSEVLKALSEALRKTEEAYLDVADKMVKENPELALMGSCVLAMLMMGEDIYLMNVGDSRAVLGQKPTESYFYDDLPDVSSLQLTVDHNTYVKEEVERIRSEHPDDPCAMVNDRVKGSLKVTRAFGAGFLKQYFTNQEVVSTVELFMSTTPEGDPAQHLIEEVLFRAAKKAGIDFHELLEIPQGERRRYHDDVSVIVISLEGRIWHSSV
ncbi:hypothetical protein Cgig2_010455 [Carnegiea gigantea]|uniref:PPM-type phosphatase domain-containing protein n=1 Tax=Carnegiea gigantea TaxID=171969 RepID=A0A9Q1K0I6_9CARY|nr:hypothetical protein Cgig2_010455 [Carnegiea gigantea]